MNNNNNHNRNNSNEEPTNSVDQNLPDSTVNFVTTKTSMLGQMLRNAMEEMFPWLYSSELFKNSLHRLVTSIRTDPCSTLFYLLVVVFGFVPFLCFFLFIAGAFVLSLAWFAVCQAISITFAALVFGGFMIFLLVMCCSIASIFGIIIHVLFGWRRLTDLASESTQVISNQLFNYLAQFRSKNQKNEEAAEGKES